MKRRQKERLMNKRALKRLASKVNFHGRRYRQPIVVRLGSKGLVKTSCNTPLYEEYEDRPVRSHELDNDDDHLSFSKEINEVTISNNFIHHVIKI